ncbi:uncharacterized protein TNCV_1119981 [Trichonephila clavipes]|uniref:Uncharacterized protein n=1 Tax=Trichonephila clavipes TaxID=2585209 RepID=A0A8X6VNW2_TRICX|nr:uncharacterized protein TNCV_1119981 [Trichonephila clavipes]
MIATHLRDLSQGRETQLPHHAVARIFSVGNASVEPEIERMFQQKERIGDPSEGQKKCILHLRFLAASPLVRLVEGKWEVPDHPQSALPQNWGETELNRSITYMVLKATTDDRRHLALYHDEFPGPGLCRSGGISNNSNNNIIL